MVDEACCWPIVAVVVVEVFDDADDVCVVVVAAGCVVVAVDCEDWAAGDAEGLADVLDASTEEVLALAWLDVAAWLSGAMFV